MKDEKLFETKIKNYLKSKGVYYFKFFANAFTPAGIPDLIACVNGHFVAIEVKAENGRPSELQKYNIERIKANGGIAMIVYPKDFDRLKSLIDELME